MIKLLSIGIFAILFAGCNQPQTQNIVVEHGDKYGAINRTGYIAVKSVYKQVYDFRGNYAYFDHPHLINLHWIHNSKSKAYAIVQNIDKKFGIIDENGQQIVKPIYDSITYFFDGFARIQVGKKYGLMNEDFKIVLKPIYDNVAEFTGNIAIIENNNKYGCINKKMELKIEPSYTRIYLQKNNILRTNINNKWGYLDNQCNILTKATFDYGYNFSNGIAKVVINGKIAYLNAKGKLITKPIFTKESANF